MENVEVYPLGLFSPFLIFTKSNTDLFYAYNCSYFSRIEFELSGKHCVNSKVGKENEVAKIICT